MAYILMHMRTVPLFTYQSCDSTPDEKIEFDNDMVRKYKNKMIAIGFYSFS